MWKKSILASLVIGVAPFCFSAQENSDAPKIVYRPADEVFEDAMTGLKFNSRIGSYNKFAVSCSINPVDGTIVRYQNEVACGDIYIYALDAKASPVKQQALNKAFADAVKNILSMPKRSAMVKSVSAEKELGMQLPSAVSGQCFLIQTENDKMKSILLMFLCKGKIIKIRTSYPAGDQLEEQDALLFCKEILNIAGVK